APTVVDDQIGRPTFADDLAAAVTTLLRDDAPFGDYHVTGGGEPASWADVACAVYRLAGAYFADKPAAAPRPLNSVLDTSKAAATGIAMPDWRERLADHVR